MPIYEIEAPDGRVFEVEGDREPTQDELTALVRDFKPEPAKAASRGGTIPGFGLYETASRVSDALLSAWDNAGKIGEGAVMAAEAAVEEAKVEAGPLRGALKGAAGALKGAAIVGSAMAPDAGTGLIGFDTSKDPRGGLLYKAGEVVEKLGSTVPAPAQPTFMDDVAEGVGQVVPGIVAAAFTGPAGAFVVGGATEVADAYSREMDRQEKAGEALDFGKAYAKATGYGLAAGAIEARFGAGRIVSRVKDALAGKLRLSGTKELILGRMKDAGVGFTEEAAQRAIQDLIVDGKLDLDAIKQEGGVGAVVQAILGLPAAAIALQPRKAKDIGVEAAASQAERAGLTSVAAAIRESEATLPKDPEAADFEALVSAPIPAVEEQPAPEVQLEVPQEQPQPKAQNEGQAQGQVQEGLLTVEEVPGEAIKTEDPGTSYDPATLEQEVVGFLGGESLPESVTVVSEPDGAWAAKLEGGKVVLNAAQIKQGNATKVVLEEGLHGVWDSPELSEAWRSWRQVTDADVAAEREARAGLDTSEDVLREEAAIRRLIENRPADQGFIRKIYEAIRTALRRVFGLEVPNTEQGRAMLEQAAKDYLTRRNEVSKTRFAAPQIPQQLLDESVHSKSAKGVLYGLVSDGIFDDEPALKALVNHVLRYDLNASISVSEYQDDTGISVGAYDKAKDSILLFRGRWNAKGPKSSRHAILHEYIHALTVNWINKNQNSQQFNELLALAEYAQEKLQSGENVPYGLSFQTGFGVPGSKEKLVSEFIAELFSSRKLQDYLKSIKAPKWAKGYKTLWDEVVGVIKDILGIKSESVLDASLKRALDIVDLSSQRSEVRFAAPQIKPSKGYFKGDYKTRPDKDVSAEADAFVGQFPTETEAVAALENPTANVPMDTRAWAVGIIGDRLANRYYQTEDPAEQAAIQKDLIRLAKLGQVEGMEQGQGFRARQRMKDKLAPHSVLLTFFNLINDQQREVIDPIVDVSGVAQGVKEGMDEAGGQAAEKIGKAVKGSQQPKEATKEPEPATKTAKRIVSRLAKSQSDTPSWPAGASDDVEAAVRAQLEQQSPTEAFASVLTGLGVNPDVSAQLSGLVAREIEVRKRVAEAKEDQKAAETIQDSSKIARLLEAARVQEDVNWSELFQSSAATQEQRQKELFDRIQNDPRFARLSKAQRAELANTLFKAWELERLRIFRQEFDKLLPGDPETPQKRAVKKILPKLLRYLNLGMLDADAVRNEIARLYGMETFDSDLSNQLKKLSQQAQKLPDGSIQQNQVLDKMHSLMMSRSKLPLDKVLADFWYSNVLGRTSTYLNVLLGTLGTGLWAQTLLSAKVATANMAPGDALRMWQAYFGAIKDAIVAGAYIIYTGDRSVMPGFRKEIDAALSMKDPLKAADTFETIMAKARMEGKPGKLAWAFTQAATKRIMTALDLIGSAGVGDAAKFAAAYNQGNQEAINKLRKRFDKEANKQAETQAREELGPKAPRAVVNARKREILEAGIDQSVLDAADSVRRRAASNAEPHGIGGFLYRTVKPWPFLAKSAAGLQFVRAAANMANWVTDAVPGVGLAKYAQSKIPPKHPLYVNLSKEDQDLAMAAQIAGLAVIAGTAAMFLNDDEEDDGWDISGGWSNLTPQRKKLLRDGGERPYTITTPFGAFNYKQLSGLNAPLALVGTLRDQQKYDKEKWSKETAAAKLFHAWLFGSIGIVKDLNTVSSITDVVGQGAVGTDEALMARVVNFMTRFGSGFIPYRGALGEFDQYSDRRKYMPDKEDVVGAALRNVPFARRAIESGADIDVFGEPIRTPANLLKNWVDITKQPEEWRTLASMAQKGYWLTEASLGTREIVDPNSGEKREMTATEKVAYAQARGRYIKVLVLEDREALLGMNAEELADYWRSKVSNANKQAMRAAREVASEGQ